MRKRFIALLLVLVICLTAMPVAEAYDSMMIYKNAQSNEATIYDFLISEMGFNTAAACGVLANIEKESSFRNNVIEYGYTWENGGGYGICQWTNSPRTSSTGRRTDLVNWCGNNGYDYKSLIGQLNYLKYELNTSYYYNNVTKKLKAVENTARGAYTAAYEWCYYFERPAGYNTGVSDTRGALAQSTYWNKYNTNGTMTSATSTFYWPLSTQYPITTGYTAYANHNGVDMAASKGTPLYAIFNGTVTYYQAYTTINGVNYLTSYGNHVWLNSSDGTYSALYAHLNAFEGFSLTIPSSQTKQQSGNTGKYTIGSRQVKVGDVLGYVGTTGNSTGNHLHFGLKINGSYVNPTNYLSRAQCAGDASSTHNSHSYSGSYYEAAHPHREYQMCSCGATKYTGKEGSLSSCSTCNPVYSSATYNAVLPFKGYLNGSSKVYPYSNPQLSGSTSGEIWTTDECTITAVYTNGACKVTYPVGSTTKTAYTSLSNFIGNTSVALTQQTVNNQATTYIRNSTGSTVYGYISSGDVIYRLGTSGTMTQVFYPTSAGYKLAWVKTSDIPEGPTPAPNPYNSYFPIKGYICATSTINAYASDYTTDIGDIWTTDFCYITAIYDNGWCCVTYPVGSGTKTGYVKLSNFVYDIHATHVKYKANAQTAVYHTKNLVYIVASDQPWYIDAGDEFYVLCTQGSASQVLYPIDAQYGGGYKLGWVYTSALPKTTYTVSYNANGGSGAPSAQTKSHGTALTLSSTIPTRTGYAFVGWATSASASTATYTPGASYTTDASVTLYAVWTLNKYEITYDANGGVNAPATQNKAHGTAITLSSSVPEKQFVVSFNANGGTTDIASRQVDCTFLGWNTSASATSAIYQPSASFTTNANTTLYAVWKNNVLAQYDFPMRDGYVFDGWYTAASGGTQVTSETVIDKNMTLYAHWSLATYIISYDANGGTGAPGDQIKTHGVALTLSTIVPTRKNYIFAGWGTEENRATVQYQPGGTYSANADMTLVAVWEFALSPTIQVDSVSAKADETVEVPVRLLDNPGINTFTLGFSYDTTRLKLKNVTVNSALGGQFSYNTKAVWLANADSEFNGQILTLTFEVLTTAKVGDAYVTVTYNAGEISNYNEENVDFAISAGKVTVTQAHVHSYVYKATTNPTTSATGVLTGTCSKCSGTTTVTLPKLNTTDYTKTTTKAPTCTATGTDSYKWNTTTYGTFTFTATTAAKGHTAVTDKAVAATCTATGLTEGSHCSVCNAVIKAQTTVAALGHNYASKVTAPTCTAQGYTTYTCSRCSHSYKDTYTNASGHSYSYKATTNPTSSATGVLTGICSKCSGTTTVTLPKLNTMDYTKTTTKAPTCTATGTDSYKWKTTTYGTFSFTVTTPAKGHTPVTDKAVAATCTASGLTEGSHCSVCNVVIKAQTTVAALGHSYTSKVTAPTCTAQGFTTHTCSRCSDSYKDAYTAMTGHSYDSGAITTQPTCTEAGIKTYTCTVCKATKTESVPAKGHTAVTDKAVAATCTTEGLTEGAHCSVCNVVLQAQSTVAALGHRYEYVNEGDAHNATCGACGDTYFEAHSYTDGHCVCGAVENTAPVVDENIVINHTLNLASDISVSYVVVGQYLEGYEDYYLEIKVPNYEGNQKIGDDVVKLEPVVNGSYIYFTLTGVTAVQMNDELTATLHMTKGGKNYVSKEDLYSIATYAYNQLNKASASQSLKRLCADLLCYGGATQSYKGYRTDALVTENMTAAHKAYMSNTDAVTFGNTNTIYNDLSSPLITWVGKTLNLDSKVIVKFVFDAAAYTGNISNLTLKLVYEDSDGIYQEVTLKNPSVYNAARRQYAFDFDGLMAAELRTAISAAVYAGDMQVSQTLRYSPDAYGNNKTGALLTVCKALFAYSDSAKAYFAG